jgi:hypothetical protein
MREPRLIKSRVHGDLIKYFMVKLDDGWYFAKVTPEGYYCKPKDGWRVWWWKAVCTLYGIHWGFEYMARH